MEQRFSDNEVSKRDIPSFIEPRPPLIQNPFMRPRPQKGTNLLKLFEDDSEVEEPELVQVYLRMKPHEGRNNLYEVRSDKCLVTSLDTTTAGHGRRTQHNVSRMYKFSRIFDASRSQKEIFEEVVKENLKKLPEGHSFTLLTYGASGSGKTYTLMGTVCSPGLVPRSLEYVFKLVNASQQPSIKPSEVGADKLSYCQQDKELQWVKQLRHISAPQRDKYRRMSAQLWNDMTVSTMNLADTTKYYIWVSFVEIYNEAVYDLLAPPDKRVKLHIREDNTGQVFVKGVRHAFVRTGEEAYDVMVAGKHNLVVAATGIHAHSSRSHCIFTITMLTETDGAVRSSCVRLCDLAGCERARATRNTGARMQESRAINSSLHVLERCLHMLRRNQKQRHEALVPYRESKLTRLLGSGLSGYRGEAVSMVVTLNPAPQYAQETKHVLSLAAVAQDIQINNTMMSATQLESSASTHYTQDSTLTSDAEIMKLRFDNELLQFELMQAQARIKELMAAMEEKQEETANIMRELVEEAKDMTRQYYEAQISALKSEMEDMAEEYEERLSEMPAAPVITPGTPTTFLQTKVAHLMTENTVLEDKLSAEILARERAEKEVQHLRTCIEERDEKAYKDSSQQNQEVIMLDSEDESSDLLNQSLEPVFRKEYVIRSKTDILRDKGHMLSDHEENVSDLSETLSQDHEELKDELELEGPKVRGTYFVRISALDSTNEEYREESNKTEIGPLKAGAGHFVRKSLVDSSYDVDTMDKSIDKQKNESEKTRMRNMDSSNDKEIKEVDVVTEQVQQDINDLKKHEYEIRQPIEVSNTLVSKAIKSLKISTQSNISDSSLKQFELLELASQDCDSSKQRNSEFGDLPILKEKRKYFDDIISFDENDATLQKLYNKGAYVEIETMISSNKTKELREKDESHTETCKNLEQHYDSDCEENKTIGDEILISNHLTKQRTHFDITEVSGEITNKKINNIKVSSRKNEERSPSIVKDDTDIHGEPSTMKILLGENITKPEILSSIHNKALGNKHDSIDVFEGLESPHIIKKENEKDVNFITPTTLQSYKLNNVDEIRNSIGKLVLEQKTRNIQERKDSRSSVELEQPMTVKKVHNSVPVINVLETTEKFDETQCQKDNTIENFEKIYKELSTIRPTDFDMLVAQETDEMPANEKEDCRTDHEYQQTVEKSVPRETIHNKVDGETIENKVQDVKYNLRHKGKSVCKSVLNVSDETKLKKDEILAESDAKGERQAKNQRSLRLRRRKNLMEESEQDNDKRLRNIVNLKKEFSDVTLGLPAFKKEVHDIPSPDKFGEEENLPPLLGIQSCPSKSVTRSRRKLFTPRAEPLEESLGHTGDSPERVRVPRPSYHRARARRKL